LIQTDITRGSLPEARKQEIAGSIPLRRLGDPDEVARVCLFLASDLSSYISGATVDVNGGMYMR
jgi:NAD(P)-dependent dehydrogenase (short-subunit alcohol dehydrogenase family)